MDKRARLKKQMDFVIEVDKVKNIVRQTVFCCNGRERKMMRSTPGILLLWQSF